MTHTNGYYSQTSNGYIKTKTFIPIVSITITVFLFGAGFFINALAKNDDKIANTRETLSAYGADLISLKSQLDKIEAKLDKVLQNNGR